MYAQPTPFSRSVVGLARLLVLVAISEDRLNARLDNAVKAPSRLSVWFPNPEEQWPTETAEDGTVHRLEVSPVAVAHGEIKHARLKLDGSPISRAAALDFLNDAAQDAALYSVMLRDDPFLGKGGKRYSYEVEFREDGEIKTETVFHTHKTLREELVGKIRRKGLDPKQVMQAHGYRR